MWPQWNPNRQPPCLFPPFLSVLQVTGEEYVLSRRPFVTAGTPRWTRVWSLFRTTESSCLLDTSSWPSPMSSDTAWDHRSVTVTQSLQNTKKLTPHHRVWIWHTILTHTYKTYDTISCTRQIVEPLLVQWPKEKTPGQHKGKWSLFPIV